MTPFDSGEIGVDASLRQEIDRLSRLKTKALKIRFRELFGEESPSSNRMHLFRRLAWRLQASAHGGLSEPARERANQLANDLDLRLRAPREFWNELTETSAAQRDLRLPPVGTALQRIYQGRTIVAKVLDDGFEFQGRHFESLSAVAYAATGTRWNGFLFFRLNANEEKTK